MWLGRLSSDEARHRLDREGVALRLAFRMRDAQSCEPIENAIVDIWHCDALGSYSGFEVSDDLRRRAA